MMAKRITLLAVLPLLLFAGGCLFSPEEDNDDGGPIVTERPIAFSREQLMENFQWAYENRDIDAYREVLDTDFRIYLQQETVAEYGLARGFFEYAEEIIITENMFSGNPPSPDVGAISNIDFVTLSQIDSWHGTENPDFPGAEESQYNVRFTIMQETADGQKQLNISGRIVFFLSSEQVEYNGRERTRYRMVGQIDETDTGV